METETTLKEQFLSEYYPLTETSIARTHKVVLSKVVKTEEAFVSEAMRRCGREGEWEDRGNITLSGRKRH